MIYLDNAATTQMCYDAREIENTLWDTYGNPASSNAFGLEARGVLERARADIAKEIGAGYGEVFFTSGATEGNNWAIRGRIESGEWRADSNGRAFHLPHVVTTAAEHHSVLNTVRALEERGLCEVTCLPVSGETGAAETIIRALELNTVLVSVMLINNETGARNQVERFGKIIREWNIVKGGCHVLFHVDATQALGKTDVNVNDIGCDMLTASGHKFHAGKGCGIMYIRSGTKIANLMEGGGQQLGMRPGTEDPVAAARMAVALRQERAFCGAGLLSGYTKYILDAVREIPGSCVNGHPCGEAGIVNVSFDGVTGEALLNALEARGVVCSAGSACSMGGESHVLRAMGLSDERIQGAIRISVGRMNHIMQIREAMQILRECVDELRRAEVKE